MKFRTRALALGLSVLMVLSSAPQTAFATELTNTEVTTDVTADSTAELVEPETKVESSDEKTSDEKTSDETQTPAAAQEETEAEVSGNTEALEVNKAEVDYLFTVTEDGTLAFAEGKTVSNFKPSMDLKAITNGEIKKIPAGIFEKNTTIKSITIPSTVTEFADSAFQKCTNLASVTFEGNTIAATKLPTKLFYGCTALAHSEENKSFAIPAGVEIIDDSCFSGCSGLCYLDLKYATSLKTIGDGAFADCSRLVKVTSVDNAPIETLQDNAFKNCKALGNDFKLPATVASIGEYAFSGCTKLTKLDISNLDGSKLELVTGLNRYCFAESKLEGVLFPANYKVIQPYVFAGCTSLKTFKDENSKLAITTIKADAFNGCTSLDTVEIPETITTIENYAFRNCTKVKTVKIYQGKSKADGSDLELLNHSLPINSGMVVYGYSGNVEEWVGKHVSEGVSYKSLYTNLKFALPETWEKNSITARGVVEKEVVKTDTTASNVKVDGKETTSDQDKYEKVDNITIGTLVEVTPVPATNYSLVSLTHGPAKAFIDTNEKIFKVSGEDLNSDGKIQIDAAFASNVSSSDFELEAVDSDFEISMDKDGYRIETEGEVVQLNIVAKTSHYGNVNSNPSLWSFSSSDTKFVTVNSNGKLVPKRTTNDAKNGYVTVTATLQSNTKVALKLRVYVNGSQQFKEVTGLSFGNSTKVTSNTVDAVTGEPVVLSSKAWIEAATSAGGTRNVKVRVNAVDTLGKKIDSSYKWKSSNESVAKMEQATSSTGDNVLNICGVGEATVTVTRAAEKNADGTPKVAEQKKSFIVRVIDPTPYVVQSKIIVNKNATLTSPTDNKYNGKFELLQSYGGEVVAEDLTLVKLDGNKWVDQEKNFALELGEKNTSADGVVTQAVYMKIYSSSNLDGKESNITNLYVRTTILGDYYYTKLPSVVVTSKQPNPAVKKIEGKVNTFYKATANTKSQTSVEVTIQTLDGYSFDTADASKLKLKSLKVEGATGYDKDDYFVDNFTVEPKVAGDYTKLVISQKAEVLKTNSKGKPVTTGYICVPYTDGTVAEVKITVPTTRVVPKYALETTTVSTHALESGQKFEIKVIDKEATAIAQKKDKKAKVYVDFTADHSISCSDAGSYVNINPVINTATDTIEASMPSYAASNTLKANLLITSKDWNNEYLGYPYTIKIITKQPAAKLSSGTIALNTSGTSTNNVTISFKEPYMTGFTNVIVETREKSVKKLLEVEKLDVKYVDGKLVASFKEGMVPAKGSYGFTVYYYGVYSGGNQFPTPAKINFTVKVDTAKPTVTVKSALKLNDYFCDAVGADGKPVEVASSDFVYKNITNGSSTDIDLTNATLLNVTNSKNPITYELDAETKTFKNSPVTIEFKGGKLYASLNTKLIKTQKFRVVNAKVDGVTVEPVNFTVNSYNKEPKVTVSTKGTINVLDSSTSIEGTIKITNFNGVIDANKLSLVREDKAKSATSGAIGYINPADMHFSIVTNAEENGAKFKLTKRAAGSDIESVVYALTFSYAFGTKASTGDVTAKSNIVKTTPKQTNPALNVTPTEVTLYARNTSYSKVVVVESKNENISVDSIKWNKKTSEQLQDAFGTPVFDKTTGQLQIKIKNAALLKKNTQYVLYYEVGSGADQLKGSAGTVFTVKVNVK